MPELAQVAITTQNAPAEILERIHRPNAAFLKEVPLFRGLPDSQMRVLDDRVRALVFAPGEPILKQGQANDQIYFIKNGVAAVTITTTDPTDETVDDSKTVAYLHEDDIFGETGLFSDGTHYANANVTAVTMVTLLILKHQDFREVLNDYHPAAMEVARLLTERLHFTSNDLIRSKQDTKLYLVIGVGANSGATLLSSALVTMLSQSTNDRVVLTKFPHARSLSDLYGFIRDDSTYRHPAGYDVHVPFGMPGLPAALRLNLIWEELQKKYGSVVMALPDKQLDNLSELLEFVSEVILVAQPSEWEMLQRVAAWLDNTPYLKSVEMVRVVYHQNVEDKEVKVPGSVDFVFPFYVSMPPLFQYEHEMPDFIKQMINGLISRIATQNQICIYLPKHTSSSIGEPKPTDTTRERILWMLQNKFGEVNINHLKDGQNNRFFYEIASYVNRSALNKQWREVINQIRAAKEGVLEEPLAVELNHHLILV